ncbi:MAG: LPXTG cell wall anchor domain-containing protein [Methanoculleus sp.]
MRYRHATTLILLLALTIGIVAGEDVPPTFPHDLWGDVMIDGSPAPAGTEITALIGETACGSITTTKIGGYGSSSRHEGGRLVVSGTDGQAGETITFLINGRTARETATFAPDSTTRLDLSVARESTLPGTGGGGSSGSSPAPVETSVPTVPVGRVSLPLSATGEVSEPVMIGTADGAGSLTIGEGTRARDADGNPLGEVTIARATAGLPPVPPGATIGFALDCGPAGATFDPPVTLTYTLSEEEWGRISDSTTLQVMWYNPGTGEWQEVPTTVDPVTRTVTAEVSHFSLFALTWAAAPPAEATTGPAGTAPGDVPAGPEQSTGDEAPWALIAAGVLVIAAVLAGWYLLRKR